MSNKNSKIFRAYDIRGVYGKDITEEIAELVGKSFGTFIGRGKKITVARDVRNSGESLKKSLISGLTSVGCDVVDIGVVTTPMMYFAVKSHKLDGGITVTASHNPPEWNGFKMTKEGGVLCSEGFGMEEIKEIFTKRNFRNSQQLGKVTKMDISEDYKNYILPKITSPRKLKIVLDPGNGASCFIAEDLFKRAGHEIFVINGQPDGSFSSRPSDPTDKNVLKLKEAVIENEADFGIAFDGDGDRIAFVDNEGKYISSGNITIPIFSEYYLNKNGKGKIVYDVCCSSYVEEMIRENGGLPIVSKVGHSFVMNTLIKEGAIFGGEYSNHLYFSDIFGFDDALFAGLKMAEILASRKESLSEIVDSIPKYPASGITEIPCDDAQKFEAVKKIGDKLRNVGYKILDIDGIKAFDKENNWVLIRASNTMPVIKINSEAKTEENMIGLSGLAIRLVEKEVLI